jgi:hypothetical protein
VVGGACDVKLLTDRPLWLCHVDSPLLESALLRRTQIEPAALRRYFSLGKTVAIVGERPNTWRKKPPAIRSGSRTSMTCLPVPTTCNVKSGPASLDLAGSAYLRPFISISRAQQVEEQNIPPILITYGSREFGDRCSAISIGSWIFPEFLTKRPDEDVRLLAEEPSELVNIP